jgi:hypothetical protein
MDNWLWVAAVAAPILVGLALGVPLFLIGLSSDDISVRRAYIEWQTERRLRRQAEQAAKHEEILALISRAVSQDRAIARGYRLLVNGNTDLAHRKLAQGMYGEYPPYEA